MVRVLMKRLKDQGGFAVIEAAVVVVVVIAIGAASFYVYQSRQPKSEKILNVAETNKTDSNAQTDADSDENTFVSETDYNLINASLTKYCSESVDEANGSAKVDVAERAGVFFKAGAGCVGVPSGFEAYLKKENGQMTFLFAAQEQPGKEDGVKYGLPAEWYTTEY